MALYKGDSVVFLFANRNGVATLHDGVVYEPKIPNDGVVIAFEFIVFAVEYINDSVVGDVVARSCETDFPAGSCRILADER